MTQKKPFNTYFNPSVSDIPFLYLLYWMATPLAIIFIKFEFKPNTITTLSNISAFISYYIILIENNFMLFYFFWMLALFLDICDGIVSRNTNQQSPQGSFYDHFTDQIKIVFLFLSAGMYYDTTVIWIFTFLTATFFLLYSILNGMIKYRIKLLTLNMPGNKIKKFKLNNRFLEICKRYFYNNFFIIQGNFVVYLGFIFIEKVGIYIFSILFFIILFNLVKSIKHMNAVNHSLQNNNLKWN